MTQTTYNRIAHGRQLTLETVNTWELNEGDVLFAYGSLMVCGPFEDEVTKYGKTPEYDSKGARWCTAMITGHEPAGIPLSWTGKTEDGLFRTWRIQGNTRANWCRVIENTPAEGETA
jgi:hypothetical protein